MGYSRPSARRGFTVVELLVVIGIIAVLIAILLPTAVGIRASARATACAANLGQINACWKMWAQNASATLSDHRLPDATGWIAAAQGKSVDDRFLYCPDGDQARPGPNTFSTPSVTHIRSSSGAGHPDPVWVPDPLVNPNATFYTMTLKYQNARPNKAVMTFTRNADLTWTVRATQVDSGGAWGGPPVAMAWGTQTWPNVTTGMTINYTPAGGGGSNYGFNAAMSRLRSYASGRVLAMDYDKLQIDYDDADGTIDDAAKYLVGRHSRKTKFNVLFTDGSVQLTPTSELKAASGLYKSK